MRAQKLLVAMLALFMAQTAIAAVYYYSPSYGSVMPATYGYYPTTTSGSVYFADAYSGGTVYSPSTSSVYFSAPTTTATGSVYLSAPATTTGSVYLSAPATTSTSSVYFAAPTTYTYPASNTVYFSDYPRYSSAYFADPLYNSYYGSYYSNYYDRYAPYSYYNQLDCKNYCYDRYDSSSARRNCINRFC